MRKIEPLEIPPQLISKILDSTVGPRPQSAGWRRWFAWIPQLWQPRFAMGVATVAATLLIVLYTAGLSPAKLKRADLSPANVFRTANRQVHLTYARSAKFVNDLRVVYEIRNALAARCRAFPVHHAGPRAATEFHAAVREPAGEISDLAASRSHPGAQRHHVLASLLNTNWAGNFRRDHARRYDQESSMNCAVHTDVPATGFCRNCGKALCPECTRERARRALLRAVPRGIAFRSTSAGTRQGRGESRTRRRRSASFPAWVLVYNGQYMKALIHVLIFAGLIAALSSDLPDSVTAFLGIALGCFYCYMPIEAYRTARARRDGQPEPANLIDGGAAANLSAPSSSSALAF